jgi:hypothetical protein
MLCFRVFARIHSGRSLDSFLDLNPILCPRFLNSFPCHTSKKTLLNPVLATLSKNSKMTPCFATDPSPRRPSHFGSAHLPSSSYRRKGRRRLQPTSFLPIPYPLSFHILAHSFALFCTRQKLNSFVSNRFRTLCQKHPGWGHTLIQTAKHSQLRTLGGNSLPRITGHGTPNTSYQSLPSPAPQCYHSEET